jgi:hypothetical protein
VPQPRYGDARWIAIDSILLERCQQIQQADNMVVIDMAEDVEFELVGWNDALDCGVEVVLLVVGWSTVDQYVLLLRRIAEFENQRIAELGLHSMKFEHWQSPIGFTATGRGTS